MAPIARSLLLACAPKLLQLLAIVLLGVIATQTMSHADGLDSKQPRGIKKKMETAPSSRMPSARRILDDWPDQPTRPHGNSARNDRPIDRPAEPPFAAPTPKPTAANLDALKRLFRRPKDSPSSASRDEIALGARLFSNVQLSADHKMSCATCHDPTRALSDGRVRARGNAGQPLQRNTPALWNLAWQKVFYWDGRSPTLEAQAKDAIERDGEMDSTLEAAALWITRDSSYAGAFERVYRTSVLADPALITRALAAYERSLVSPATRFDRWIEGDATALNANEIDGFRVFTGKARCLACHGGWRFTDDDAHVIGLRSPDRGRAARQGAQTAGRSFKTPSLRESAWTAPYMHDGSLGTFDAVLDHYTTRLKRHPSLAPELRSQIILSAVERSNLIAFLRTLSSATQPRVP